MQTQERQKKNNRRKTKKKKKVRKVLGKASLNQLSGFY